MAKPELEFFDTSVLPWQEIKGAPGQYEKILSRNPETGDYTRMIYSQADLADALMAYNKPKGKHLVHDIWEEVFIYKGGIIDTALNQTFGTNFYACRPPGMLHGPLFHPNNCISIETRYPDGLRKKPELEFFDTGVLPWQAIKGTPGQYEKILSRDPETGDYTRLIYSQPDLTDALIAYDKPKGKQLIHDIWEEVFIILGGIIDVSLDQTFVEGYYCCRPPGMKHGPLYHPNGCISLEFRYRDPKFR